MNSAQTWAPIAEKLAAAHNDRRRCRRISWVTHVTVSVAATDGRESGSDDTTSHDFSPSGIGFIWRQHIEPGTALTVWFEALPQRPELAATTCHCTHIGGAFYHVGAEFIDNT